MLSAKFASDDSELRALENKNEIGFHQLITPASAVQGIRAEQAIRSSIGPKLNVTYDRLKAAILDRLNQRPDLLKSFSDAKPVFDELKQSRATVKALLDDARKKAGR